jgi:hypothetical protein
MKYFYLRLVDIKIHLATEGFVQNTAKTIAKVNLKQFCAAGI